MTDCRIRTSEEKHVRHVRTSEADVAFRLVVPLVRQADAFSSYEWERRNLADVEACGADAAKFKAQQRIEHQIWMACFELT